MANITQIKFFQCHPIVRSTLESGETALGVVKSLVVCTNILTSEVYYCSIVGKVVHESKYDNLIDAIHYYNSL